MERSSDSKRKFTMSAPSGKLAFSLKPKSKLIAPTVKFGGDDDEDEVEVGSSIDRSAKKQKGKQSNVLEQPSKSADVAPSTPSGPAVKKVADKLASFVAKNGRQFEHVTRQKNPGDSPFKFLFDESCADYKYYEYKLSEEERALSRTSNSGSTNKLEQVADAYQSARQPKANYQIPASALYEPTDSVAPGQHDSLPILLLASEMLEQSCNPSTTHEDSELKVWLNTLDNPTFCRSNPTGEISKDHT